MKLYLLRWNPAFSSFTNQFFDDTMSMLLKGKSPVNDWSIHEPEGLEPGDWWILSRVGGENDGLVGIGRFTSLPEKDESWRKNGKIISYADIAFLMLQRPEKTTILGADELKAVCPGIDWAKGHSGVLIPAETAERLAFHVAEKILSRKDEIATPDFAVEQDEGEYALVCNMLTDLCPVLLAKLKKEQGPISLGELDDLVEFDEKIGYDEAAVKAGKSLRDSLELVAWIDVYDE